MLLRALEEHHKKRYCYMTDPDAYFALCLAKLIDSAQ